MKKLKTICSPEAHWISENKIVSLGDVLYNLCADKIVEANQTTKLPLYVSLCGTGGTAMRYDKASDDYYRDAGIWSVDYKYMDGKLVADCEHMEWIDEKELVEITYEEWKQSNNGYVGEDARLSPDKERENNDDLPY